MSSTEGTTTPETAEQRTARLNQEAADRVAIAKLDVKVAASRAKYMGTIGRFSVTSPASGGGIKTQSIRDLTRFQVESLQARGYKVEGVPPGTAIRPVRNITTAKYGIRMSQRRSYGGITRHWTQTYQTGKSIVRRNAVKVSSAKRLTQEPSMNYHNIQNQFSMPMFQEANERYWHVERSRYIFIRPSTAVSLRRRGWTLQHRPEQTGGRTPGSTAPQTQPPTQTSPSPSVTQYSSNLDTKIQQLTQELQNQKNWIESMNRRLSEQMTAMGEAATRLGQSTTDRSQEIQKNDEWSQAQFKRIDETLVALGNAVSDASKAATTKQAENTVKQVGNQIQQKAGGITEGITGFITNPSNIILIIIVVMMLVMIKFK